MTVLARVATHLAAAAAGWWLAQACRWWADHVPSHNCEEIT